jgi:hypothetical protein
VPHFSKVCDFALWYLRLRLIVFYDLVVPSIHNERNLFSRHVFFSSQLCFSLCLQAQFAFTSSSVLKTLVNKENNNNAGRHFCNLIALLSRNKSLFTFFSFLSLNRLLIEQLKAIKRHFYELKMIMNEKHYFSENQLKKFFII